MENIIMGSNPGRRARRATRFGHRQPTRMTEYQRARQAERPRAEVVVHAHLHGLDINAAVELYEAGAFEGVPCEHCGQAIEWSADADDWQHHATKAALCRRGTHSGTARGVATPPDWYTGEPIKDVEDAEAGIGAEHKVARKSLLERSEGSEPCDLCSPKPVKPPRVVGNPYDSEFARGVLHGLQTKTVYQGTVQPDEAERRRLRTRDANRSRRANRRARIKRNKHSRRAA